MTDIVIILLNYHPGLPSGEEEIQLNEEDIKMLAEVCEITPTGELIIETVDNRYKEIVVINEQSIVLNNKETNEQIFESYFGQKPIPRSGNVHSLVRMEINVKENT